MTAIRALFSSAALVATAAPALALELAELPPLAFESLQREQFALAATADGIEATNPAHAIRARFDDASIEVAPFEDAWSMTWHTCAWGRAGSEIAPGAASRTAEGPRVEYRYASGLVEWYVNRVEGLEQGFSIPERPHGAESLVIAGALPSGLAARLAGDTVELVDQGGTVRLRYGALHAFDATGRELPSFLQTSEREIRLVIDDAGAVYPLEIDPLITSAIWTQESNQAFSYLGWSTATAGDVNGDGYSDVIVGNPGWSGGQNVEGRVVLYLGSATGLATTPSWSFESDQAGARLGRSVAPAGDVNGDGFDDFLAGAPYFDAAQGNDGRAYLFKGTASGTPSLLLTYDMNELDALFGSSVSRAGDVNGDGYSDVVIGAPEWGGFGDPFYIPVVGAVRLFLGGATPDNVTDWSSSGVQTNMRFGCSVAGAGDVNGDGYDDLLVGANLYDLSPFNPDQGIVKCWYGSASGISGAANWQFIGAATGDSLGYSVAGAGDIDGDGYADVVVGAPGKAGDTGAVYIFRGGATGLPSNPAKVFQGENLDRALGASVATAGDFEGDGHAEVIAGAPDGNPGRLLLVFFGMNDEILGTLIGGPLSSVGYGFSVSGAGDVDGDGGSEILVSAPMTTNGEPAEGRVYLYGGQPHAPAFYPFEMNPSGQQYRFGKSMASAGDVNGDGIGDFVVGIPNSDEGGIHVGRVNLYFGSEDGIAATPDWTVAGTSPAGFLGSAVAGAGDVNGDGYADLVLGARGENRAYVYHGSSSGPGTSPHWSFTCEEAFALFGDAVAGAGDVNGDGYADIVVGAPGYDNGLVSQGLCRVFFGSPSGVQSIGAVTLLRNQGGANFGQAVAGAGDVDRDGFDDLLLAAPNWDNSTFTDAGGAFLYRGSVNGPLSNPIQSISIPQVQAHTGISVCAAGDLDADGYADALIGAPDWDGPSAEIDIGRIVIARGSPTGFVSPTYNLSIGGPGAHSGASVGGAGDVNADGFSDVVIGSSAAAAGNGKAVVWPGAATPSGLAAAMWWWADFTSFGQDMVVCTAGDLTGDGFPEVAVSYPHSGAGAKGQVRLHYGSTDWGTQSTAIPQLPVLRGANGNPIALGGLASDPSVELAALARTAAGRGRVALEHQMAPMGQAFPTIGAGPRVDSGAASAPAELAVALPTFPDVRYRWRLRVSTSNPYFPHGRWMTNVPTVATLAAFRSFGAGVTAVPEIGVVAPAALHFESLAPNPSRGEAVAEFSLARRGRAHVDVVDVSGRRVASLVDAVLEAGSHETSWAGTDDTGRSVAAGVYFVRVAANDEVAMKKLVRVK